MGDEKHNGTSFQDEFPESVLLNDNGENSDDLKVEEVAKIKREILNRVVSGQIENIRDRVAFILNHSNEARNSDIELAWLYWETFESEIFSGSSVTKQQMMKMARISSLTRVRAKLQNEYRLFLADEKIRRLRGVLEDSIKSDSIDDKPSGIGIYNVFVDESGKTQEFMSVGSLWFTKFSAASAAYANSQLNMWKRDRGISFEFHFKELTKNRLSLYKEYFVKYLSLLPETGFKLIVVRNKGFSDRSKAITDLTCHLLRKGIEHENSTGRAPLPRILQLYFDEEESGSDHLKSENIKERLISQRIEGLYIGEIEAVSSKGSHDIQIVDLFTASVNRRLHEGDERNYKDEFSSFVLDVVKFDIDQISIHNSDIDNSTVFDLTKFNCEKLDSTRDQS